VRYKHLVAVLALLALLLAAGCDSDEGDEPLFDGDPTEGPEPGPTANLEGDTEFASGNPVVPAITWQRSGGIAGICQRLLIDRDETFGLENCETEEMIGGGELPAEAIAYLGELGARFGEFEWEFVAPSGSADMFEDRYSFAGVGTEQPAEEEMVALNEYLGTLAAELATAAPDGAIGGTPESEGGG
jgi:hypothetical protein